MKKLLAATAMAALLFGCASTPQEKAVDAMTEMQKIKNSYLDKGTPAGMGIGTSKDKQIAYEKADQNARVDLAKEIDVQVKALAENFKEDVNEEIAEHFQSTSASRVNTVLNGATMTEVKVETTEDGHYEVYGIMTIKSSLVEEFIKMLEEQGKKAEAEKIRATANKMYNRLDEKIK